MVPKLLSQDQKNHRIEVCQSLKERTQNDLGSVAYTRGVFGRYDTPLEPYHILYYYRNIGKSIIQYEI
jgi:hypothetical protein